MTTTVPPVDSSVPLRPPTPEPKLSGEGTSTLSLLVVFSIQVVLGVQLLGLLASRITWLGDDRAVDAALRQTALLRSFSLTTLSLDAGDAGFVAEVLITAGVIVTILIALLSSKRLSAGDLPGLLSGLAAALFAAGGLLRFGSPVEAEPAWPARVIWLTVVLALAIGAAHTLSSRVNDRGGLYDLGIVLTTLVLAIVVPLMLAFGFWRHEDRYGVIPAMTAGSESLEPVRVLLVLAGVAPVLVVGGYFLLRPPWRRWAALLGALLVFVGAVFVGRLESSLLDARDADVLAAAARTPIAQDQVDPSCAFDRFGAASTLTVRGEACRDIEGFNGMLSVWRAQLPSSASNIYDVPDPLTSRSAERMALQKYGQLLLVAERSTSGGRPGVTAYSLPDAREVWRRECESADALLKVRFSGGEFGDSEFHARLTERLYGVSRYVGLGCDAKFAIIDPATGDAV